MGRQKHEPGAVVRFRHWDARKTPKARRPGIVEGVYAGNLALFYGSTMKRGGYPEDAIEVSPRAHEGSQARELADYLPGFVDEPTFFHGSMLAEAPFTAPDTEHLPALAFPNDLLEDLQQQAEDRVVGFVRAWGQMAWLRERALLLDALWWRTSLSTETEALLTLVLCDGWSVDEVRAIRWRDVDFRRQFANAGDEPRWLLPHTIGLLAQVRDQAPDEPPWTTQQREDVIEQLRLGWQTLAAAAKPRGRRSPFPSWEQVLQKITR